MRTFAELRELAMININATKSQLPDLGTLVLVWNKNAPTTEIAIAGEVEPQRDLPRMLREIADKLEREKGKKVIAPH
jgi:hypothetical protein